MICVFCLAFILKRNSVPDENNKEAEKEVRFLKYRGYRLRVAKRKLKAGELVAEKDVRPLRWYEFVLWWLCNKLSR